MAPIKKRNKLLFVDTNIFLDAITSDFSVSIIKSFCEILDNNKVEFILPEVIKVEIITQYQYWKNDIVRIVEKNLSTENILGIEDTTDKNSKKNQNKRESEIGIIDDLIKNDRNDVVAKIKKHYETVIQSLEKLFTHKNTKNIRLDYHLLLEGMKRSLLKKSPSTRTEKSTESAHTKDVDCVAFESLISYLESRKESDDFLIICVSDKDYLSDDGKLHNDIESDLSQLSHSHYQDLLIMLEKEFQLNIATEDSQENMDKGEESLTLSPKAGIIEGSSESISQEKLSSSL